MFKHKTFYEKGFDTSEYLNYVAILNTVLIELWASSCQMDLLTFLSIALDNLLKI